ncbi:MAG TPA: LLM class flavin-dependent oxidoreductase [Jatrophihabitans sp.]
MPAVPLSVLDLVPVSSGSGVGEAVRNTVDLARQAERYGYHRYWFAEHHLNPGVAGASYGAFSTGNVDAWATWSVYAARARGELGARVLSDGAGINSGLNVLSATDTALGDPRKRAAIQDFASRVDKSYAWSKDNPGAFDKWYAGFAHQPIEVATQVRPEETTYQRIPVDAALAAQLQKTYDTWVRQGLFPGGKDLSKYLDARIDPR